MRIFKWNCILFILLHVWIFSPFSAHADSTEPRVLSAQLKHQHSPIRLRAVHHLVRLGKAGVQGLLYALQDRQWRIRDVAKKGLARLGGSILPQLKLALQSRSPRVRLHVAEILGQIGPSALPALPTLHTTLKDREWGVRVAVMRTLGGLASPTSTALFLHHLQLKNEPYWRVRALAAHGLRSFTSHRYKLTSPLLRSAQDKHEAVRYASLQALLHLHSAPLHLAAQKTLFPALKRRLYDASWRVRWAAAHTLGSWKAGTQKIVQALLRAFRDKKRDIREVAAISLGRIGHPARKAIPLFLRIIERDKAMPLAVRNLRSPLGRMAVAMRLKNKLPYLKMVFGVTRGLAEFGPLAVRPILRSLRKKRRPNPWLLFTLGCIGPRAHQALPLLQQWSRHRHADYRWMALLAMSRIGPQDRLVRMRFWQARKDPDEVVRIAAAQALAEVRDPKFVRSSAYRILKQDRSHVRLGAKNLIHFMKTRSMTPKVFLR